MVLVTLLTTIQIVYTSIAQAQKARISTTAVQVANSLCLAVRKKNRGRRNDNGENSDSLMKSNNDAIKLHDKAME